VTGENVSSFAFDVFPLRRNTVLFVVTSPRSISPKASISDKETVHVYNEMVYSYKKIRMSQLQTFKKLYPKLPVDQCYMPV